jgi:phosphate ABC transporter phosphate-binding protein
MTRARRSKDSVRTRSLRRIHKIQLVAAAVVLGALGAALSAGVGPTSAQAASYVPVSGAGSTWSQVAMDAWRVDVAQYGMRIDFAGTGSSDGRNQFRNGTVDFANSDIPYGLKDTGVVDPPPNRGYAYMPIVAGGTTFMYNLVIGGHRVTNLRLSGQTLTKIFTNNITKWNDPAIAADNPGLSLPALKIEVVVRSDGSGSTAQFSEWMASQYPSLWNAYCSQAGRPSPCGTTSFYPVLSGTSFTAQNGDPGVQGYVEQSQNVGSIGYVEYAYAIQARFPVAKILNKAGYYTEPTPQNVAVSLLKAAINNDKTSPAYLTQVLTGVYNDADPRTYPLSSYSYMIIPTATTSTFTTAKGYTLASFGYFFLCQGQQQVDQLGYSALPINLVEDGFAQLKRIPGAVAQTINVKGCNNPTFSSSGANTLATTAPQPAKCDKQGKYQCSTGTAGDLSPTPILASAVLPGSGSVSSGGTGNTSGTGSTGAAGGGSGSSSTTGTGASSTGTAGTGTSGSAAAGTAGSGTTGTTNTAGSNVAGGAASSDVAAIAVTVPGAGESSSDIALIVVAGLLLLGITLGPPAMSVAMQRKNKE